ncbi:MAG TPA: hypothetical protein PLP25_09000 [Candidatus Limiplasma sp.]|nr:hypothetical protein [Candidatus Limiplasma sp.]HPS81979.1 hypothetical protein [Candidatus Limiplasma sp.]
MNAMPWTAPQPAAASPQPVGGRLTGVSLSDVRRLKLPMACGPFGHLRPPLDHTALEMSLELAYMAYTLDLEPWMHAGWSDISIQVDNHLQSGVTVGESESAGSERIRMLMNTWKITLARMALKENNPVAQIRSALRQRERSDTIKAVTMLHPAEGGRYVVAIGFMGTGSRFYDWFSNFRFTSEDGFHKGFQQLTEYFEQSADRILFPATAAALHMPSLSLRNILAEMRDPDSRFSLWMAGHSQGGAVMQVFCHRLLENWGVLPRHVVGYGFASPTVSAGPTGRSPAAYPLYHIINTDDLVPRVGALKHLGICLRYEADEGLRNIAYGWSGDPEATEARSRAELLLGHIADTPTMLETIAALCETVAEEKTEESLNALLEKRWSVAPLEKAFTFAGDKAMASLKRLARYARVAYRSVTGRRMDEAALAVLKAGMAPTVREYSLRALLGAMRDRFYPPHMLCREHFAPGAYGYIVRLGSARLRASVWEDRQSLPPGRRQAEGFAVFIPEQAAAVRASRRKTLWLREPAGHSPRDRSRSALHARRTAAAQAYCVPCRRRMIRLAQIQPAQPDSQRPRRRFWRMRG